MNLENTYNKQTVKIIMVGLLIFGCSILVGGGGFFLFKSYKNVEKESVKLRADSLAHQLALLYWKKEKNTETQRAPSSESVNVDPAFLFGQQGTIGQDKWGQPYRYYFVPNEEGRFFQVLVWSIGKNQINNTDPSAFNLLNGISKSFFRDDDIGTSIVIE